MAELRRLMAGAVIPDALQEIARREGFRTASIEGVGGVGSLTLGYYNRRSRRYDEHHYRGFMEVTSLLGNITEEDGKPFLHLHGTFGRRDMSVIGGHVVKATVLPTLEFTLTSTTNRVRRKFEERFGLNLIEES